MDNKGKNEELQNRREFFKEAAKKALPIIGALALTSVPIITRAAEVIEPMGCDTYCNNSCRQTCETKCIGCDGSCRDQCDSTCKGGCDTRCITSCDGSSRII